MGAFFVGALAAGTVLFGRAKREAAIEAERSALRTELDENARRLHELQGSRFDSPTAPTHQRELPDCRCAQGDPLCAEIPGLTCR